MYLFEQFLYMVAIVFIPSFILAGFVNWYIDWKRNK